LQPIIVLTGIFRMIKRKIPASEEAGYSSDIAGGFKDTADEGAPVISPRQF
jgi:hypothetical protein